MKILIFGGTGFVGKALTQRLLDNGHDVVSLGRNCDLTIQGNAEKAIDEHRPEAVYSIAGYVGGIGFNERQPGKMFRDNMLMSLNAIHAAAMAKVKIIQSGTVCAYPAFAPIPFREETIWDGRPEPTNEPYGIARRAAWIMLDAYRRQYGINGVFLVPVNMYGPNDNFSLEDSHVIPALIRKILEAKTKNELSVKLWGDGSPTREFLYVGDCAEALVLALTANVSTDPINIGSGQEISIKNLATKIANLIEYDGELVWDIGRPNGQMRRCLDTSKAKEKLGFVASTDLDTGLKNTIDWFKTSKYWRT